MPALGAHAYLGDAFFGLGLGHLAGDAWMAFPYLGYRFSLGEVEAQLRLQAPFRLSAQRTPGEVWASLANLLGLLLAFPF